MKKLKNPYLQQFNSLMTPQVVASWSIERDVELHRKRIDLTKQYSFAIPNRKAVRAIADLSPVVELGAGTGYWASLISQAGGRIEAFDRALVGNEYKFMNHHYPVREGTEAVLDSLESNWTLFLCWPCYNEPFAFNALSRYGGNHLVYVGEGNGGCCGDDRFFSMLNTCWEIVNEIDIPQWPFIRDRMYIYRRKRNETLD